MKDSSGRPTAKLSEPLVIGKRTENSYMLSVRFEGSFDLADFRNHQSDEELYEYLAADLILQIVYWIWSGWK